MTTLEFNDEEKSLAAWGITLNSAICERSNSKPDTYSFAIPVSSIAGDAPIAFMDRIIIRRGRTADGEEFTGGYVAFIGYVRDVQRARNGAAERLQFTCANAWWWLEETQFQQPAAAWVTSAVGFQFQTSVILFTKISEGHDVDPSEPETQLPGYILPITNGKQIQEVLEFALEQYAAQGLDAPFLIGEIAPDLLLPAFPLQEISCAAAIIKSLQLSTDCVVWWDYTTEDDGDPIPTINVSARAAQDAVSLPIKSAGSSLGGNVSALHWLQPSVVIIFYRITGDVDGEEYVQYARAKYGPNGANSELDPEGGLFALIQTIDLAGSNFVNGYLKTAPMLAADAATVFSDPNVSEVRAWWASVKPELLSTKIRYIGFYDTEVLDENGDPVNLSNFPNMLVDGSQIQSWMRVGGDPVEGIRVTVTAKLTYDEYDEEASGGDPEMADNGTLIKQVTNQQLSWSGTLTNATTGWYRAITAVGEEIPTGLAQKLWETLSVLQYQGSVDLVESEVSRLIGPNNTLNLTGGRTEWATMAAQVQSVREADGLGLTSVTFGPPNHLNSGDLAALWRFNRARSTVGNLVSRENAKP